MNTRAGTPSANGKVQRFGTNTLGRDLIIGDIHGHFALVEQVLVAVNFDPTKDRLFSVGDLVDRGPESDLALEWIAKPWFHAVCGNHEDMAIRWVNGRMSPDNYAGNGGAWNLNSSPEAQEARAKAFGTLPIAIEIETARGTIGIVHADCPSGAWSQFIARLDMGGGPANLAADHAQWSRARIDQEDRTPVDGIRAVVVGHTPLKQVAVLGNTHYIDTMGWRRGHFTLLNAESLAPENKCCAVNQTGIY